MCFLARARGRALLRLFAEPGRTGLVFRPAAVCPLSVAVSKPSALFKKRRNFFFCRVWLQNLDGRVKWLFSGAVWPRLPHKRTLGVTATFRRHWQRRSPQVFSTLKAISSFRIPPQPPSPPPHPSLPSPTPLSSYVLDSIVIRLTRGCVRLLKPLDMVICGLL